MAHLHQMVLLAVLAAAVPLLMVALMATVEQLLHLDKVMQVDHQLAETQVRALAAAVLILQVKVFQERSLATVATVLHLHIQEHR